MNEKTTGKIIIEGVTPEGTPFRPRDWAERMSGRLAILRNRRLLYSPLLQPSVSENGHACVLIDPLLKTEHPALYQSIMEFARTNKLKISGDEN